LARIVALDEEALTLQLDDPFWRVARLGESVKLGIGGRWSMHTPVVGTESVSAGARVRVRTPVKSGERQPARGFLGNLSCDLMAHGANARELEKFSVPLPRLTDEVEYRRASREELGQILYLRTQAYRAAGKFSGTGTLSDDFDNEAIHLCAFYHGVPIASLRLMIHPQSASLEHEAFFQWRHTLPSKSDIVEISRVSVHPDFQRCRVLEGLFQRTAFEVLSCGRSWILGSATDKLLPMYRRIGCAPTDIRFRFGTLGEIEHTIFVVDVRSGLLGHSNLLIWLFLWRHVARASINQQLLRPRSMLERLRVSFLLGLGRLADVVNL
jgi:hypothetical protein